MKCTVYAAGQLKEHKYATIFVRYQGKWIFSRHKDRTTWETAGGHVESGETPLEAAKRELWEETGALEFQIEPVCDLRICREPQDAGRLETANGSFFFAEVTKLGPLPDMSEMAEVALFDSLPDAVTHPDIYREIFPLMLGRTIE